MPDSLNLKTRASLFNQLAAMERAGLPAAQAMGLLQLSADEQSRVSRMGTLIGMGLDIPAAGLASRLFTEFEASLIQTACSSGSPARVYQHLADDYTSQVTRLRAMKSRMVLPAAFLVIADFAGPLPRLFSGVLSANQYLLHCLAPLVALAIAAYLFTELPRRLKKTSWLMHSTHMDDWYRYLPWFGPMSERRDARDFFGGLALLLEAGMPILQALPISEAVVKNAKSRREFTKIKPRIEAGASFAEAIRTSNFPGKPHAHALILSGESSGKLPDALLRYSTSEAMAITQFDDTVADWVPRIAYIAVATWAGYVIVQSHAFVPSLDI